MKIVDSNFEIVKPFLDQDSICIVELATRSNSKEGGLITITIDENHSVREISFFLQFRR